MRRVQISCDICTRFAHYLYSTKQCWIIKSITGCFLSINSPFLNLLNSPYQSKACCTTIHMKMSLIAKLTQPKEPLGWSPISIMGKQRKPMNSFSCGYHGKRYCSWVRTTTTESHKMAAIVQQLIGKRRNTALLYSVLLWYWISMFQLTPVKMEFPLTSITWTYRGFKLRAL